ncbi:MAG: serine/threonine protein kinase [Gammaproteobacteria bacterium]
MSSFVVASAPYARLTPDCMLDALDAVGLRGDGRFLALNSYENRVYQVSLEDGRVVVPKFYRPERWSDDQILEEHAFVADLAAREIPVVPAMPLEPVRPGCALVPASKASAPASPTLASFEGYRFAVFPRRGGRTPELDDPDTLEWTGRFIGRIHAVGAIAPFVFRPAIDVAALGEEPREWLLAHGLIPPDLIPAWTGTVDQALEGVRRAFERAGKVRMIRLHGDCHAGNVLWTDDGPHFVDFDDARMGPAIQDLWMLLSGDRAEMTRQLSDLISGYEDFVDFDRRELQLIEALRTLRLIHYSAWIGRRWGDPAFPAAFPWFGTQRYWQDRVLELREQVAAMQEPALQGV